MNEDEVVFNQRPSVSRIEGWYTAPQVAAMLGLSRQRVNQLANAGRFPHIRTTGRTMLISEEDVERYREESRGFEVVGRRACGRDVPNRAESTPLAIPSLEELVVQQWPPFQAGGEFEIENRHLSFDDGFSVAILAKRRYASTYVVVLIESGQAVEGTLICLLRAMGTIKRDLPKETLADVEGVIIASSATSGLMLAVACHPKVRVLRYAVHATLTFDEMEEALDEIDEPDNADELDEVNDSDMAEESDRLDVLGDDDDDSDDSDTDVTDGAARG